MSETQVDIIPVCSVSDLEQQQLYLHFTANIMILCKQDIFFTI